MSQEFLKEVKGLYKKAKEDEEAQRKAFVEDELKTLLKEVLEEIKLIASYGLAAAGISFKKHPEEAYILLAEVLEKDYGLMVSVHHGGITVTGWGK